jgi:hypothetical protein
VTTVDLTPITLRAATLQVGADDFTAAVDQVTFVPDPTFEWLTPPMRTGVAAPVFKGVSWTCVLGHAQDLTPGSLTRYLLAHVGERRTVLFTPQPGSGQPVVTADVLVMPGQVGGDTEGPLTAEATLPVVGAPEVT